MGNIRASYIMVQVAMHAPASLRERHLGSRPHAYAASVETGVGAGSRCS